MANTFPEINYSVSEWQLPVQTYAVQSRVSAYGQELMGATKFQEFRQVMRDELVMQLKAEFASMEPQYQEFSWPTTWWDALKLRWFPRWALRRWPSDMSRITLTERTAFPDIAVPPNQHTILLRTVKPSSYTTFWKDL